MSAKGCGTHRDCKHGCGRGHGCGGGHGSWCKTWRIIIFLLVLLAFLIIVVVILFIVFALHWHRPQFYLQNATVRELNVSDGLLTSNLQFSVVSQNPNDRIGIIYNRLSIYALYLGQQITGEYPVPPFYQNGNDIYVLAPNLTGNCVPLATTVCDHLNYELQSRLLSLSLKMEGTIRWKVGSWTSGHHHLNVNCWGLLNNNNIGVQAPLLPGTTCHVEV